MQTITLQYVYFAKRTNRSFEVQTLSINDELTEPTGRNGDFKDIFHSSQKGLTAIFGKTGLINENLATE